jgi:SNF2 family DNA or RNA helicase
MSDNVQNINCQNSNLVKRVTYEKNKTFNIDTVKGVSYMDHQVRVIEWMKRVRDNTRVPGAYGLKGGILVADPGLGKSLMGITIFRLSGGLNLLICPKTLVSCWVGEIRKFFGITCKTYVFHSHYNNTSTLTYREILDYNVVIIPYESLRSIAKKKNAYDYLLVRNSAGHICYIENTTLDTSFNIDYLKGEDLIYNIKWENIIADESQKFVNCKSRMFYSMMALRCNHSWCFSGTPIKNNITDMYSQLRFCGYNSLNPKFTRLDYAHVSNHVFTETYETANIVLPDCNRLFEVLELDGKEKDLYKSVSDNLQRNYNQYASGAGSYCNVLSMFITLRKVCSNPGTVKVNLGDEMKDWISNVEGESGIYSSKMKRLKRIIEERKGKIIIFSTFQETAEVFRIMMEKLLSTVKYTVIDGKVIGKARDSAIQYFKNDKDCKVLFATYGVGSEGLTITEATTVVHVDTWWSPIAHLQAERRAIRIGQTKNVTVIHLIVKNSIESYMQKMCYSKMDTIDDVFRDGEQNNSSIVDARMLQSMIGNVKSWKMEEENSDDEF